MKKTVFFMLFLFCTIVSLIPVYAQKPAFMYTQNWLDNVPQSICMQRSREILQQNNLSVSQVNGIAFQAENNSWLVQLTCQSCGDKTITTIMLSTSLSNETAVEMRERILYYIATGKVKTIESVGLIGGDWESNSNGSWQPASVRQEGNRLWFTTEFGDIFEGAFESSTRIKATKSNFGAAMEGSNTIKWDNGVTWRRRSTTGTGKCGWLNGQDNTQPADPGRGVTDWNAHYTAVKSSGSDNVAQGIKNRMQTLGNCLDLNNYAKVFADVSVKIAEYGVSFANWTNDLNNTVLGNDVGCGSKDWNAHFNAVTIYGTGAAADGIKNRLALLARTISVDNFAKLYADISVIIATYGTTK